MTKQIPLTTIADRITLHLIRFEADPVINARPVQLLSMSNPTRAPYSDPSAWRSMRGVSVSYRGDLYPGHELTRSEAERYLQWLDAGNVGMHSDMPGVAS
jgi:hypothetical protein